MLTGARPHTPGPFFPRYSSARLTHDPIHQSPYYSNYRLKESGTRNGMRSSLIFACSSKPPFMGYPDPSA